MLVQKYRIMCLVLTYFQKTTKSLESYFEKKMVYKYIIVCYRCSCDDSRHNKSKKAQKYDNSTLKYSHILNKFS